MENVLRVSCYSVVGKKCINMNDDYVWKNRKICPIYRVKNVRAINSFIIIRYISVPSLWDSRRI